MQRLLISASAAVILLIAGCTARPEKPITLTAGQVGEISMETGRSVQDVLFDEGNYAMFIHFGLYSKLEGEWKGKAYYGNAEWIMSPAQAGIPVDEYMAEAATFNPSKFDAEKIVALAKEAGMKYIVITSKHHEGFAMFDSDACSFNITDATPFGRDIIGELSEACHRNGLGIGFYYSQFQDWTAPGGGYGPTRDADGKAVSFDDYFWKKCVPQVEEITTRYGDVQLIWFDTPDVMGPEYSKILVDIVRKNQPHALVSSRVGNGMGDYETLGDMEVPTVNHPGRWEGIDVTQVGWGYSKADHRWKTPGYIVRTLVGTIARGGTFMMNVGPTKDGEIAPEAAAALSKSGEWISRHPKVIYRAEASPWGHALPWGDAVVNDGRLYLIVTDWPSDGKLLVPGIRNGIRSARIDGGKKLKFRKDGTWLEIEVPCRAPEDYAGVIELTPEGELDIDATPAVIPGSRNLISTELASSVSNTAITRTGWMENYGEWKNKGMTMMNQSSMTTWAIEFPAPGYYDINLEYRSGDRHEWRVTVDGCQSIEHSCGASDIFSLHPLGWIRIDAPGIHEIDVQVLTGPEDDAELSGLYIDPVML
ncbi:MAG: alpha-L-fucosidase [Bacteroidales bacterium]|nr:alpha-L-fucosidase [Bacteroidales bacterium]